MSELAEEHYQKRIERLEIDHTPLILSGQPWLLFGEEEGHLSLHLPDPANLKLTTARYTKVLESLTDFVTAAGNVVFPGEYPPKKAGSITRANRQHADSMVKNMLFPGFLKAGHIKNVRTEAITREEIKDSSYNQLIRRHRQYKEEPGFEDTGVFLMTSAELYAGRTLGYSACLTLIQYNPSYDRVHHLGTPFKTNELLARSGIAQSRAVTTYVHHWGVQNPQIQPVRRGRQ